MTYVLGLTGSIGMGKTATAALFAAAGLPVWDADAAVHRLYGVGGAAVWPVAALYPDAVRDGALSRERLREIVAADPVALDRIEGIVHPLLAADRAHFLAGVTEDIAVLDIPLLFETGLDKLCDGVAVVSAPPEVQRARVLARPGMDEARLAHLLSRQMPDSEKRARATWVIETLTPDSARDRVADIIRAIRKDRPDA